MISRRTLLRMGVVSTPLFFLAPPPLRAQSVRDTLAVPELRFGGPEFLAGEDGLRMVRQRWYLGADDGVAWRVSAPRNAAVSVHPSAGVKPIGALLPPYSTPWAAINGGFYNPAGRAMGAVIAAGITHSPYRRGGGSGILQVTDHGVEIVHHSVFQANATYALQSIDRIVANSQPLVNVRSGARVSARSAVALTRNEIVLILVASERSIIGRGDDVTLTLVSGYGMPLWAFSRYLVTAVGAESALNLDGGVSAQMAANIDGRQFRVRGLRGTINALLVRPQLVKVDGRQ